MFNGRKINIPKLDETSLFGLVFDGNSDFTGYLHNKLVWAITWALDVRIGRFNSPREDIEIVYKFKVVQLSKDKWISPESGLKVSLRISFQNPTCFRKFDLFFKETIKTLLLLGFCIIRKISNSGYWEIEVKKALGDNLSKDWRDSVQVREISSSCIFFTLVLFWHDFSNIYIRVFFNCYG